MFEKHTPCSSDSEISGPACLASPGKARPWGRVAAILGILGALLLAYGQWALFQPAISGQSQTDILQRLFYLHLPLAWWSFLAFFLVFVFSIVFLFRKKDLWDGLAHSFAKTGFLYLTLTIITGSLWAKKAWGHWWIWEPRLTTAAVMWFVYALYLAVRLAGPGGGRVAVGAAVLGIIAFLDVPLVFFSTRLWGSVHPVVFATSSGGVSAAVMSELLIFMAAFGLLLCGLTAMACENILFSRTLEQIAETGRSGLVTGNGSAEGQGR